MRPLQYARCQLNLAIVLGLSFLSNVWMVEAQDRVVQVERATMVTQHHTIHDNDAIPACECEDWRTKQWDVRTWGGRFHSRTQAFSREKEAWHLYIRGAGPAIHERSHGRPCW
ncbi:MAG: hypothetical protein FJ267_09885 [Planctomycetes bacterium]|nr:hypothetical protein [Planctomycetota bacterium]